MNIDIGTIRDDPNVIMAIANDPDLVRAIIRGADLLTMGMVADLLGLSYYRVKILRGKRAFLDEQGQGDPGRPQPDALPPPLPIPGDPLWFRADVETWGRQTGRLTKDGVPQRARPTGRPRRSRATAAA